MQLPDQTYNAIMGQLSNHYELLKEGPHNSGLAQETRGLMSNLDSRINPGGSQGLLNGLEDIINKY